MIILSASTINPVTSPLLENASLVIENGIIIDIGNTINLLKKYPSFQHIELKNTLLLPSFINAHCHLELTGLGPIPINQSARLEKNFFIQWVQHLLKLKQNFSIEKQVEGIKKGLNQLMRSGVGFVADHVSFNVPMEAYKETPLSGFMIGEVLGLVKEAGLVVQENHLHNLSKQWPAWKYSLSPHAPYSLHWETVLNVMRDESGFKSIHLLESEIEKEYLLQNTGPFADFIQSSIGPVLTKPLAYLKEFEKENISLKNVLIVHGNYLDDESLQIMQKNEMSLVHCPGSFEYFGHKQFPLEKLKQHQINVALGTDSITSNSTLNFFHEMRLFQERTGTSLEEVLQMATINGAKALGIEQFYGSLEIGKRADIIGVQNYNDILENNEVDFMMLNGEPVGAYGNTPW